MTVPARLPDPVLATKTPERTLGSRSAVSGVSAIRAVLFDLDGTLYGQSIVRLLMALELSALPLTTRSWRAATETWSTIAEFRRVTEELRESLSPGNGLAEVHVRETARRIHMDPDVVERRVREWMFQRPLRYLRYGRRRGLLALLGFLEARHIRAGILSDYPIADKLKALGVAGRFSVCVCATDPEVNAFKPHPAGFLRACDLWGLAPGEVLYVADRPEVDAAGAAAVGMPCAIVSPVAWMLGQRVQRQRHLTVPHFRRLQRVLDRPR